MLNKMRYKYSHIMSGLSAPLMLFLLMALIIAMAIAVTGCTQTVPEVKAVCPTLPALPAEFQPAQIKALDTTEQNFKDFMKSSY